MEYTIVLEPDDEGEGFTGVARLRTQGRTRNEAIERAKEAITAYIESLQAEGRTIPEETQSFEVLKVAV